ncbi:MAG TPA: hypothetical protein VFP72_13725 [Kineosporiaceae bacterium]|nr:hypothetical protein [Kineosporiaceae bacterium]
MSTGQFTNNGITVRVDGTSRQGATDRLQLLPAAPAPATPGLALVPSAVPGGRTCTALFGAARCGEPTEEGEGNPDGYCTRHLDLMAGDQEDWESDQEYARRRRHLCPRQTGSGMPGIEWCPEPSHPESEGGFCLVHEPTYNPDAPEYDAEAAHRLLDESVPCLQCRGVQGCPMCGGTGRITLRRANWHRGDDTLLPPDDTAGVAVSNEQTVDTPQPAPTSHAQALRERGFTLDVCPGCRVEPGQPHGDDCDHACCPDCGEQLIFHDCEHWAADAEGPDRAALWHGVNPRAEVAQTLNWWTTAVGIDHLVEDYTRVLYAIYAKNAFVTWDPRAQRYQIDQAAAQAAATPGAGA